MSEFQTIAKVGSLAEGEGTSIEVDGRLVALFLRNGDYYAIDDCCPHQGASLGAGYLDEEGAVSCPWHAWRFSISDGTWCDNPKLKVDAFETRVDGEDIQIRMPEQAE